MPTTGWRGLGEMLTGQVGTPGVYEDALKNRYSTERVLQQARRERSNAIIDDVRATNFQQLPTMGEELGRSPAEMAVLAAGGGNAQQLANALGSFQEQGFRGGAVESALGDDWNAANAHLAGVASGPMQLAGIQGDTVLGNRYVEGGDVQGLTPLGEARVGRLGTQSAADMASVRQRNAAANLSDVRAAAGGFASGAGSGGAGGNQVFTFFEDGRQKTAVSPDGQNYFTQGGELIPLPMTAVALSGTRAVDELSRDNIRTELDATLGALGDAMPSPDSDPYAQAVDEISGPMASTLGRAATFITGLGGDSVRQPQREAEAFVDNVNQMVKGTLVNNPRFPQFEQRIVERLLPGPGLSSGQQTTRANELRRVLNNQIEQKRQDLGAADPVEARRINNDIRQLTQIVSYMNRGPASTRSGEQPQVLGDSAPARARIPVSRSAPAAESGPIQIQGADDYHALPSGTVYIAPDGTQRRKP